MPLVNTLKMMIFNWHSEDREDDPEEEEEWPEKFYHIYLFGVTEEGESVCIDVIEYTPFFYIKVPMNWNKSEETKLINAIKRKLWKRSCHLVSHKLVIRKDAYGFNNKKDFKFLRLVFNNNKVMNSVKWMFKNQIQGFEQQKFVVYNGNIDPMLVFMHIREIQASGWISVEKKFLTQNELTRCKHNYTVNWKKINYLDKHTIPPIKTLSFDLECYSSTGAFPDPSNIPDQIIQIGSSIQKFGQSEIEKSVVVLGKCDKVKDVKIIQCKNEKEVIKKWAELVQKEDPDQLIGYNIDNFDWTYLWKRACLLECDHYLENLSRLFHIKSEYKADKMESKAYGMNIFNIITTPGVGQIDLLHWFRKETKLDSYKLDSVAEKYLGDKKRPVSPQEIFDLGGPFGTPKSRATVADYCAQDTALPLRLMDNRCMLPNLIEMSKVTYVPLTWLITRGQQIKVYSQIQKELRSRNFLLPEIPKNANSDLGYEGATVLKADRGSYFVPISGLDFKSLYPSIMIAHNLCPTTWVRLPKYDNIEGVEYKHVEWGNNNHKFVQNVEGVVPGILTRLWGERNKTKAEMKKEKDPRMKAILNGKQLAIKVSMNSIYGFFGVTAGILPCKPIAATVTYIGRNMIEHSKNCAEKWYNGTPEAGGVIAKIIYGDSVTGDMPVTLKVKGGKFVIPKRIDSINTTDWFSYNEFKAHESLSEQNKRSNKEQALCDNALIWSANGWVRIVRVIRHKVKKKLYRVVTSKGIVVCTEDHSLIRSNNEYTKPKDVEIGDELLHRFIDKTTVRNNTYNLKEEMKKAFYNRFE